MACSLRAVIACGIILAVLDIMHGLTALGFYGYRFISHHFYLCPRDLDITFCQNRLYFYEQMFTRRTYFGLCEGGITLFMDIIYIISLVKHLTCLSWMWIFKSFAVMGVNVFYISLWMVRQESLEEITYKVEEYQRHFLLAAVGLTISQLVIMIAFCIIGAIFSYKVAQERRHRRRSIRNLHQRSNRYKNGANPSAPSLDAYDDSASYLHQRSNRYKNSANPSAPSLDAYDDSASYLNPNLNDSTNKLPLQDSSMSIDKTETLRQEPTEV